MIFMDQKTYHDTNIELEILKYNPSSSASFSVCFNDYFSQKIGFKGHIK